MNRCKRCLLPAEAPGAALDNRGLCEVCSGRRAESSLSKPDSLTARQAELDKALRGARGGGDYDVLVCLSGGKDSLCMLNALRDYDHLRILAFTTGINIPAVAWDNMQKTLEVLGVDHLVLKPSNKFYTKLFRYLLQNQEARGAVYTLSYVYAPLFEGDALRVAVEKQIPLVLAGYSPGQPEPERMEFEFSRDMICYTDWTPPALRASGEFDESELSRFWNPSAWPSDTVFPRYMAPFHAWPYDQDQIMQDVMKLGLVRRKRNANPIHSNYPIQWLLMYSDLMQFGYNPYAPEFCALIREGRASRKYWKVMFPVVDFMIRNRVLLGKNASRSLDWLDMAAEEMQITQPRGAYDPDVGGLRGVSAKDRGNGTKDHEMHGTDETG